MGVPEARLSCLLLNTYESRTPFFGPLSKNGILLAFNSCRALALGNFLKEIQHHEETEGLFTYRIADRRGDHSDHRGHRHSELDAVAYGRE